MQTIQLKKFGNVLVGRPGGQESFNAIRPQLNRNTPVEISFEDMLTVTPSWLDEFLTHLADFNEGKIELLPTANASVLAALPVLAKEREGFVADIINRYLDKTGANKA